MPSANEILQIKQEIKELKQRISDLEQRLERIEPSARCVQHSITGNQAVDKIVEALVKVPKGLYVEELEIMFGTDPRMLERYMENLQRKGHVLYEQEKYMLTRGARAYYEGMFRLEKYSSQSV